MPDKHFNQCFSPRCSLGIFVVAGTSYALQPFIFKKSSLPTPVAYNGQHDTEFKLSSQIILFIYFMLLDVVAIISAACNLSFLGIVCLIFGHRFNTIEDILKLTSVDGQVRDSARIRQILNDCQLLHSDVLE